MPKHEVAVTEADMRAALSRPGSAPVLVVEARYPGTGRLLTATFTGAGAEREANRVAAAAQRQGFTEVTVKGAM